MADEQYTKNVLVLYNRSQDERTALLFDDQRGNLIGKVECVNGKQIFSSIINL